MLVSATTGSKQLCIFEQWIAPELGAPTHAHPNEEVLTVLAGGADLWIEDDYIILSAGQSLIVPARRKHGFRNVGATMLHMYAVLSSAGFEALYDGSPEPVRRWFVPKE